MYNSSCCLVSCNKGCLLIIDFASFFYFFWFVLQKFSRISAPFLEAGHKISGTDVKCVLKTAGRDHKESLRVLEPLVTRVLAQSLPVAWHINRAGADDAEFPGLANKVLSADNFCRAVIRTDNVHPE
jgi:hypothetical protein